MIMYIYSGIVVIWEPIDFDLPTSSVICALRFASGTNDTVGWLMKIFGSQMTTALKMNIIVILSNS